MTTLIKFHAWWIITALLFTSLMSTGQGLLLTAGSKLVVNGNAQIVIKDGGFTNNGNFEPGNGTVNFTGTAPTNSSSISGSSVTGFYDLVLNKNNTVNQMYTTDIALSKLKRSQFIFQVSRNIAHQAHYFP